MENIRLSICMIVKNEERCLERCLKSLQPLREQLPCEVIITDTGSTDRTIEIAEKYADKILHFTWCNDFSAARNVGIEEAKGEWIMVLDADEELVEDVSHMVQFFNSEKRHGYYGCFMKKRNCFNAELCNKCESLKTYDGASSEFLDYRIFNAAMKPRYKGKIHEAVPYREPAYIFDLCFYHDGYAYMDETARKEKSRRNASLLEKELKENLYDLRLLVHILVEERVLKEDIFENVVQLTDKVMHQKKKDIFAPAAFMRVAKYYHRKEQKEKALQICKEYLKFFDSDIYKLFQIEIRFIQADILQQQKQYGPAWKMTQQYFDLIEKYDAGELDLFLMRTASMSFSEKSSREYMKIVEISALKALHKIREAGAVLKEVAIEKFEARNFVSAFGLVIQLNHFSESGILLEKYYPLLGELQEKGTEAQKQVAEKAQSILYRHIQSLPKEKQNKLLEQIANTPKGKEDIKVEIQKMKDADNEQKKVIKQVQDTITLLLAEPSMQEKALDLIHQLKAFAAEDEEVQNWIENLPIVQK